MTLRLAIIFAVAVSVVAQQPALMVADRTALASLAIPTNRHCKVWVTNFGEFVPFPDVSTVANGVWQVRSTASTNWMWVLEGANTVSWGDSQSPAMTWRGGPIAPTVNTNYASLTFAKGDSGFFAIQLDHDIITRGAITLYPHIHFLKTAHEGAGSADTNVVWTFGWRAADIGAQFDATWNSLSITNGVNQQATNILTHSIFDLGEIPVTNAGLSRGYLCYLNRMNVAADNYTAGTIEVLWVDIHYPRNKLGSAGPRTE